MVTRSVLLSALTAVATAKMTIVDGEEASTPPMEPPSFSMRTVASVAVDPAARALMTETTMRWVDISASSMSGRLETVLRVAEGDSYVLCEKVESYNEVNDVCSAH